MKWKKNIIIKFKQNSVLNTIKFNINKNYLNANLLVEGSCK